MIYHARLPEVGRQLLNFFIRVLSSRLYLVFVSFLRARYVSEAHREGRKADY